MLLTDCDVSLGCHKERIVLQVITNYITIYNVTIYAYENNENKYAFENNAYLSILSTGLHSW